MEEITTNAYNLNMSRYVNTTVSREDVDLNAVNAELVTLEQKIVTAAKRHNEFLGELGLPFLPVRDGAS